MPEPTENPTPTEQPNPETPKPESVAFTPEQEAELNRRMAATRRQAEADARKRFETEAETKQREAAEEAQRQKDIAAGEFDKVKTELDGKVTTLTSERDTLAQTVARYDDVLKPMIEALKAEIPAEALTDQPAEDAPAIDRLDWYTKRKALVQTLRPTNTPGAIPVTPNPQTLTTQQRQDAAKQQLAQSGQYTPY